MSPKEESDPFAATESCCPVHGIENGKMLSHLPSSILTDWQLVHVNALIDTGTIPGNFVSSKMKEKLSTFDVVFKESNARVCSGLGQNCFPANHEANINFKFFKELTQTDETIQLTVREVDTPHDIVIGLPNIRKYTILQKIPSFFTQQEDDNHNNRPHYFNSMTEQSYTTTTDPPTVQMYYPTDTQNPMYFRLNELLQVLPDDDGLGDSVDPKLQSESKEPEQTLPKIYGSEQSQERMRRLCTSFKDLFRSNIREEPAKVTPFKLHMTDENRVKWRENFASHTPARTTSIQGQVEIKEQVEKNKRLGILVESKLRSAWSQVHLVKKPDGAWRFTIDYRIVNSFLSNEGWQIPNIKEMIGRIGRHEPRYFAKMDMTAGYNQFPVESESQEFTAVITAEGIFEWTRVPMGLKTAGNYFMRIMTQEVLPAQNQKICEIYMDDVLVFAKTEEELAENLQEIFLQLKRKGVTLNPKKTELGLEEVEFLGHTLSRSGTGFTSEKIKSVTDFPKPMKLKQLQAFLGLANYFHDHIEHHSEIVRELQKMVNEGNKSKGGIEWNQEAEEAFERIKCAIQNCPTLAFLDTTAQIQLYTDASDYGMGGYLSQTSADGTETPVAFVSKAFDETQRRWSTYEKEGYAIWYSLKKLQYLLRDVPFILRTDHANLTFLSKRGSPKVERWKIDIAQFDCQILHVPGKDNIVADAISRLQPIPETEDICTIQEEPDESFARLTDLGHSHAVGHWGIQQTIRRIRQKLSWRIDDDGNIYERSKDEKSNDLDTVVCLTKENTWKPWTNMENDVNTGLCHVHYVRKHPSYVQEYAWNPLLRRPTVHKKCWQSTPSDPY